MYASGERELDRSYAFGGGHIDAALHETALLAMLMEILRSRIVPCKLLLLRLEIDNHQLPFLSRFWTY